MAPRNPPWTMPAGLAKRSSARIRHTVRPGTALSTHVMPRVSSQLGGTWMRGRPRRDDTRGAPYRRRSGDTGAHGHRRARRRRHRSSWWARPPRTGRGTPATTSTRRRPTPSAPAPSPRCPSARFAAASSTRGPAPGWCRSTSRTQLGVPYPATGPALLAASSSSSPAGVAHDLARRHQRALPRAVGSGRTEFEPAAASGRRAGGGVIAWAAGDFVVLPGGVRRRHARRRGARPALPGDRRAAARLPRRHARPGPVRPHPLRRRHRAGAAWPRSRPIPTPPRATGSASCWATPPIPGP